MMIDISCLIFMLIFSIVPGRTNLKTDQASANGKYTDLLYTMEVAGDRDIYGNYYDWGYWSNREYAGYVDLEPGYWVYLYPCWYVWSKTNDEIDLDAAASAYDKYKGLIHILFMPDDEAAFGNYYDWGFWEGYNYGDYNDLTPGYWVYSAPNWYVWADVTVIEQGG